MKQVYKYAIVQFLPYAETEEFANVGVLVCAPKTGFIDFKMANQRFARVTDFFDDLDGAVYQTAINTFVKELAHTKKIGATLRNDDLVDYIVEITRTRESLLRFGGLRTIVCDNPQLVLEKLYNRYVARDFLTKEYREQAMVKAIRNQFNHKKLTVKYHQKKIAKDLREVNLPLVAEIGNTIRVIKPLAFNQKKTTQIIEHGEAWVNRFKWLINENLVIPERVLLPVEGPAKKGKLDLAFKEVINEIKELDVNIVDFKNEEKIIQFAVTDLDAETYNLN
jgi:hypothetical protein